MIVQTMSVTSAFHLITNSRPKTHVCSIIDPISFSKLTQSTLGTDIGLKGMGSSDFLPLWATINLKSAPGGQGILSNLKSTLSSLEVV